MEIILPVNKVPFTLIVSINAPAPIELQYILKDALKPNTLYYNRLGEIHGHRTFEFKMPQTPQQLQVSIQSTNNKYYKDNNSPDFTITDVKALALKTSPVFLSDNDKEFIEFAQWFSENAAILSTKDQYSPHIYRSSKGNFTIDYYEYITDDKTGAIKVTPARIGHTTGKIQASKMNFVKYSIPIRMVILLHEYSHKFSNPSLGRDVSDEVAADVNALRLYLSLGYSEIEGIYAFTNVFKYAMNAMNQKRLLVIKDFVTKFSNGEFDNIKTTYNI